MNYETTTRIQNLFTKISDAMQTASEGHLKTLRCRWAAVWEIAEDHGYWDDPAVLDTATNNK